MKKGGWASMVITGCLVACVANSDPDRPNLSSPAQRLVIQFKSQQQVCDAAGIAALSRATGVSLGVVRPMDKGACVVTQFARHPDQFHEQQNRIAGHPSVHRVEPDQRIQGF